MQASRLLTWLASARAHDPFQKPARAVPVGKGGLQIAMSNCLQAECCSKPYRTVVRFWKHSGRTLTVPILTAFLVCRNLNANVSSRMLTCLLLTQLCACVGFEFQADAMCLWQLRSQHQRPPIKPTHNKTPTAIVLPQVHQRLELFSNPSLERATTSINTRTRRSAKTH